MSNLSKEAEMAAKTEAGLKALIVAALFEQVDVETAYDNMHGAPRHGYEGYIDDCGYLTPAGRELFDQMKIVVVKLDDKSYNNWVGLKARAIIRKLEAVVIDGVGYVKL